MLTDARLWKMKGKATNVCVDDEPHARGGLPVRVIKATLRDLTL